MEEISYYSRMYFMERTGKTRPHKIINLDWVDASSSARTMDCEEIHLFWYEQGQDGNPVPGSKKDGEYIILPNGHVEKWIDPAAKVKAQSYDSDF